MKTEAERFWNGSSFECPVREIFPGVSVLSEII